MAAVDAAATAPASRPVSLSSWLSAEPLLTDRQDGPHRRLSQVTQDAKAWSVMPSL